MPQALQLHAEQSAKRRCKQDPRGRPIYRTAVFNRNDQDRGTKQAGKRRGNLTAHPAQKSSMTPRSKDDKIRCPLRYRFGECVDKVTP